MNPTNEQIIAEAWRRRGDAEIGDDKPLEHYIIELVREGWKPPEPEPVDPDILAFREWFSKRQLSDDDVESALTGHYDKCSNAQAYLAGARMATDRERERAKDAVEFVRRFAAVNSPNLLVPPLVQERLASEKPRQFRLEDWVIHNPPPNIVEARDILAKYEEGLK